MKGLTLFLLVGACSQSAFAGPVSVGQLRCEYLDSPLGIDADQPRLAWIVESAERGQRQTAYHVLVASSPQLLARDKGDLWDSGRVESDKSTHVSYSGATLASNQACYWKVRVWDKDGQPSAWSTAALWTMGLLRPEDWQAKWIGGETGAGPVGETDLAGCRWISLPGNDESAAVPSGKALFRRIVDVPADKKLTHAAFVFASDKASVLYVNGHESGRHAAERKVPTLIELTRRLQPGGNVLSVEVACDKGASGLCGMLWLGFEGQEPVTFITDASWKASSTPAGNWTAADFDDSAWSTPGDRGEMGVKPWGSYKKVTLGPTQPVPSPLFRRQFEISKPIARATLHVSGLGYNETFLNGQKVSDHVLDPAFTRYDRRMLYTTYDVTSELKPATNALGVELGNGWFNAHVTEEWDFHEAPWRALPRLLLQLQIEYADGTSAVVASDETWKCTPGPVVFDNIRNGVIYDARLAKDGWTTPGYDDSTWPAARLVDAPAGRLAAQTMPPIRVVDTLRPVSMTEPQPGVFVFDFGQNFSGWARLNVSGPAGTEVTLRYSERLDTDGRILHHNAIYNHGAEFETDTYVLKGEGREGFEPRFAYHGFQFVQVEGFPGRPTLDTLLGCEIHTDFDRAGSFECSNGLLNRIHRNTQWSYLSNFMGYPTDCPHREKNGWTGDAQLACELGLLNFHSAAAYTKWLRDLKDEQPDKGDFPGIVPTGGWGYDIGPAWDSVYVLIPWHLYVYGGDTRVLEEHYEGMKRLVDHLNTKAENGIVSYGLPDWVAAKTQTPAEVTSTGYYYADARMVSQIAAILGRTDDAQKYGALADSIREAFNARFYDAAKGTYNPETQTALSCALYQGLAPEDAREKVAARLVELLQAADNHFDGGILGSKYLLNALTANGRSDVAYTVATQRTFPSWGYWMDQGATTLWEMWDGTLSQNHIMFGEISAWFYTALAGINPDPAEPGFKRVIVRPQPVEGLDWVRAEHESPYGTIRSAWRKENGTFVLDVRIPVGATGRIYVPASAPEAVTESGTLANEAQGVKLVGTEGAYVVYEVVSGNYRFTAT